MKKYLVLLISFVCIGAMQVKAQSFDEADLIGMWVRTSAMQSVDDNLISIDSLAFGVGMLSYTEEVDYGEGIEKRVHSNYADGLFFGQWQGSVDGESLSSLFNKATLSDFSITNGNKLHINIIGEVTLIFRIVTLSSSSLVIQPLGTNNSIYFSKIRNTPSNIKDVTLSEDMKETAVYDINGRRIAKGQKGVNIVKTGGTVYKIMRQ